MNEKVQQEAPKVNRENMVAMIDACLSCIASARRLAKTPSKA